MNNFSLKKINENSDNFAKILSSARIESQLSIKDVAKKLAIREDYLSSIENDRLDLLPSGIYKRSFIKKYSEFLRIDPRIIKEKLIEIEAEKEDPFQKKIISKNYLLVLPKIIKTIIFSLAILSCILYLSFYARKIASPPELLISYPKDNLLTTEKVITITGHTEAEAELKINGELILSNNLGDFSQTINLKSGLNNIIISAKKKYSQENIIIKQILVE